MIRPARSLGASVALAVLVVVLGGAVAAAVTPAAKPRSMPVRAARGAVPATVTSPPGPAAPPVPAGSAAVPDTSAANLAMLDSMGFDEAAGDSFAPAQIFLAWHAPYGMPGATDTISFGAGDPNRSDTLYMSFETGRYIPKFIGMFARLLFHPAFGDTLGTYWRYDSESPNYRNVEIQFDPDGSFPCPQPWIRNGAGFPTFKFDPGGAKLELIYVITNLPSIIPVDGHVRYCFARVMFRQRQWDLPGARQPVCLEWAFATYSAGRGDATARRGPGRCVSINSPGGSVCVPYRSNPAPAPWTPAPSRPAGR